MKVLQARSSEKTYIGWTGTIRRLIHRYFENRNKLCAFRLVGAENEIVSPYEGRCWCDATERELIGDITNIYGSRLCDVIKGKSP